MQSEKLLSRCWRVDFDGFLRFSRNDGGEIAVSTFGSFSLSQSPPPNSSSKLIAFRNNRLPLHLRGTEQCSRGIGQIDKRYLILGKR